MGQKLPVMKEDAFILWNQRIPSLSKKEAKMFDQHHFLLINSIFIIF